MSVKNQLRLELKTARKAVADRTDKDLKIANMLFSLNLYRQADLILCYASLCDEISTDYIITHSLSLGKRVALPYCLSNNGLMNFYEIKSLSDVAVGTFGVREPVIEKCEPINDFSNSLIIVPALAYDNKGYRLGYGKGYYDRFLQKHSLNSIGLCYNSFIQKEIPINQYDKSVDFVITENAILDCR